jgi:alpha-tubulin suppressor-like RCC1 family protein
LVRSNTTTTTATTTAKKKRTSLYMWGTDTKGSLLCKPRDGMDETTKTTLMMDVPTLVHFNSPDHVDEETTHNSSAAVLKNTMWEIDKVVCGPAETAILLKDGRCLVAGENKQGQLGVGHTTDAARLEPVQLSAELSAVAFGLSTGAFVDKAGDLYTAGFGGSTLSGIGALGQGEGRSCYAPLRVDSLVQDGCYVQQVCVGEAHITVLTTEGEVLTCGAGSYGRLGNFETIDQMYLEPVEILTQGVTQISGGKSFTLALTDEGVLYGWGRNHKGQLGTGLGLAVDMYAMQSVPQPIEADELLGRKVTHVSCGHSHAACITASGELFYWGMSLHLEPVRVDSLLHTRIVDVACGEDYTLAVGEDGKVYSFGVSKKGALGQGSVRRSNQAALIEALQGKKVVQVSAGWKHAACLVEEE